MTGMATTSQIIMLAKGGQISEAIAAGEAALAANGEDPGLVMFVGVLYCRQNDLSRGVEKLRRAVALAPGQGLPKVELARALLAMSDNIAVEEITAPFVDMATPIGYEMQRVRAYALSRINRAVEAAETFNRLILVDGADFESWRGLGVAQLLLGDAAEAVKALDAATRLAPSAAGAWTDLARARLAMMDTGGAVTAARRAVQLDADDVNSRTELARALVAERHFEDARNELAVARLLAGEDATRFCEIAEISISCKVLDDADRDYRCALEIDPASERAWLGRANVLERCNRIDELEALITDCERRGMSEEVLAMPRARALRSRGNLTQALAVLDQPMSAPASVDRFQLIGDIADRLGDTAAAFSSFSAANGLLEQATVGARAYADSYRENFRSLTRVVTPTWYSGWGPPPKPSARRAPMFIFGFPRSGTTLIDTMLSGHTDTVVFEEEPIIDRVAKAAGAIDHLGDISEAQIEHLRALYFAEADRVDPAIGDRLIVDKQPLALGSTPILHRIFPDARFLFVERHPCDVVLSCFITSAQMDTKVANFFDFTGTALLYDQVLSCWQACKATLAINVFTTRYERLITTTEIELRHIAEFAGLHWSPQLIDHQSNAAARQYIASPSYAQVSEPIYTRAKGRWRRYEEHMQSVLPILRPWIERLGY